MNETMKWTEECLRILRVLSREASMCPPDDIAQRCPASRRLFALSQDAFLALAKLGEARGCVAGDPAAAAVTAWNRRANAPLQVLERSDNNLQAEVRQ